jgi:glutamine amidotransferase
LFDGIEDGARFYFVHSYFPVVEAPDGRMIRAWCDYGVRFAAALEIGRIYGTQFHPEKSHRAGIRLLENFAAIVKEGR